MAVVQMRRAAGREAALWKLRKKNAEEGWWTFHTNAFVVLLVVQQFCAWALA